MTDSSTTRTWLILGALLVASAAAPAGCVPGDTTDDGGGTSDAPISRELLADVGPEVVVPALERFRVTAGALQTATAGWVDADGSDDGRLAVQAAWRDAFLAWQELEVMQLGPAGSSLSVVGGQDLRDAIYAWPTVNRCKVDQQTVADGWESAAFFDDALVDVQGLAALENLVFAPVGENTCFGGVDINADGTWDALGSAGVQARRAGYAVALAGRLVLHADTLLDAWAPAGGDWGGVLTRAGEDGNPYGSLAEGVEAVLHAVFYVETAVKDRKLGAVLGRVGCEVASCPADVEAQLADLSVGAVRANLTGFAALYRGGAGTGLDDLLVDTGHADVDAAIAAALLEAQAKVDVLTLPLEDAATDPATVAAFDAVKALTDLVKGDLTTVLELELPAEAAGDND